MGGLNPASRVRFGYAGDIENPFHGQGDAASFPVPNFCLGFGTFVRFVLAGKAYPPSRFSLNSDEWGHGAGNFIANHGEGIRVSVETWAKVLPLGLRSRRWQAMRVQSR